MTMRFRFFVLIFLLGSYFSFASQTSDTTKVILLSLNDQHSKIDNYPQLKALVDKIRSENKYVILMAAGDNFTGNPVVDQYSDKGYPIIDLMNMTGFNATAIGNHEFDYGQATLLKRIEQARFPFLNANIRDENGRNKFRPYAIIKLDNGIRVGIISAIQLGTNAMPDSHPSNLKGLSFEDGITALKKFSNLRDSCEIFLALTHLGFEADMELAATMPELNLIMGGHTHTLTKPAKVENGVTIMQAGSGVRSLSKATVCLVDNKVVKVIPEMLNITSFEKSDEAIEQKLAFYNDNKELNKEIGIAAEEISGENELGSLMTDAVTTLDNIDIAFQNNGGIRLDYIKKGPVSVKDVYKLDPFGNEIILFHLTGEEMKSLIINSYIKAENSIDLQVSGLTYTILKGSDNKVKDVVMKLDNGKKVKKSGVYNVAMNSYIASSYKFDHKDPGQSLFMTTAEALINYITSKHEVNYKGVKRAFIE